MSRKKSKISVVIEQFTAEYAQNEILLRISCGGIAFERCDDFYSAVMDIEGIDNVEVARWYTSIEKKSGVGYSTIVLARGSPIAQATVCRRKLDTFSVTPIWSPSVSAWRVAHSPKKSVTHSAWANPTCRLISKQ
jgi:hypothetical protein